MKSFLEQFTRLWGQFSIAQRVTMGLGAAGVLVAMVALVMWAQRPDMKLLYGRLGEKEAAEVVAALEASGVKYEIGAGGGSIYVQSDKVHRIRMDLATKGLPGKDGVGFEIFDKSNFGISDFVQRTNFTRALQGELSRTIGQLNGVRSARVMVVMPENRLLLKSADSRPTASVFVDVGTPLGVDAVNSIRSLVANAVEGLRIDDVAVIDNRGNVLSEELKSDPLLGTAASQIKFRKSVEDYMGGKVETMLAKVLGPGKAVVRVSAEIDTAVVSTVDEKFDPESQVARTETLTEDTSLSTERKESSASTGATGVGANTPAANDTTTASTPLKNTEDNRKSKTQNYEINRTTTNTQKNPGAIKQVTAAVFVSQRPKANPKDAAAPARTPAELDSLRQMVVNALGIQAANPADLAKIVSIQEVAFEAPAVDTSVSPERIMSYVETVRPLLTVLLAGGIFYFFIRMLRRTKAEEGRFELLKNNDRRLLDNEMALDAGGVASMPKRELISPEMLNELIRQKPDNVAAALRGWLATKDQKAS